MICAPASDLADAAEASGERPTFIRLRRGFTVMPNATLSDPRLSLAAKGLLAYLASHREGWRFSAKAVQADVGVGRDRLQRLMAELQRYKYLNFELTRGQKGRIVARVWTVDVDPSKDPETPVAGETPEASRHRVPEKPSDGESAPIRRTYRKKNITPLNTPHEPEPVDNSQQTFERLGSAQSQPADGPDGYAAAPNGGKWQSRPSRGMQRLRDIVRALAPQ